MTKIRINQNFSFIFYDHPDCCPDICFNNHAGFYGVEEDASISVDEAKQLIVELTKFVKKIMEANNYYG